MILIIVMHLHNKWLNTSIINFFNISIKTATASTKVHDFFLKIFFKRLRHFWIGFLNMKKITRALIAHEIWIQDTLHKNNIVNNLKTLKT